MFGDSQACLHFIPLILKINSPSVHFYFYEHNPTFQISSSFLNVYNNIFVVVCLFFGYIELHVPESFIHIAHLY